MNWTVLGHKQQINFLTKAINNNKVAHAYIFTGPEGVGKNTLARNFAKILLCTNTTGCGSCAQCKSFEALTNPDFIYVNGKEGIKIEQMRDLVYKLSFKPYLAKYKIAVIDEAHNLTVEAGNALLKVLEEPKGQTLFILITYNKELLTKTILSRLQRINFGLVQVNEYEHLISQKLSQEQKALITTFAFGRPGLAVRIAQDSDFLDNLLLASKAFKIYIKDDLEEKLSLTTSTTDQEVRDLKLTFSLWLSFLKEDLQNNPSLKTSLRIRLISQAIRYLNMNVNSKLVLTNLIIQS